MIKRYSMGWIPDYPDFRDYTEETEEVKEILKPSGLPLLTAAKKPRKAKSLPASVDLREWCSPVEDQGQLGSCTARAGVGVIEYYERKSFGRHIDASRLFLYKVTRNLMKMRGDTGAYLRSTIGAMVLFGVPRKNTGHTGIARKISTMNRPLFAIPLPRIIRPSSTTGTILPQLRLMPS